MLRKNKSKFVNIKCDKCNNVQNVFNKPAGRIECLVCNNILAEPTGGKAKFTSKFKEL